eukprot:682309-Pyramimonas_sp.AAC.1
MAAFRLWTIQNSNARALRESMGSLRESMGFPAGIYGFPSGIYEFPAKAYIGRFDITNMGAFS